ncbi:fructosamine kinase family protein [Celeribacter neptunius]|uniref:Fructosamine-3-kinase n=1 Tax=Celeribacter neptunius TaxID=588602 RepID=A0A1I3PHK9_9RHOB|nr:fructosamine kinase family protein [Celeribacter neptunius]SFJ21035.1 Fructosamine-3-kinase [Celeribacter neptunius]
MDLTTRLQELGLDIRRLTRLQGGDLSEVFRLETADGTLVAKSGPQVGIEARMLEALAAAGAPVPRVLQATDTLLIMQDLPEAPATPEGWRALGRALRQMHDLEGAASGWTEDYAFGAVRLDNRPTSDWPLFWAERRLLPFARTFPDLASQIEQLCTRLPDLLPARATGLLHGDLWSGNLHFSSAPGDSSGGYFIDLACYHGDGEVDLAMLHLFGTPAPAFWDGYGAPATGWQSRMGLYQLFPALVHLRLFGAGYRGMVERCLSDALIA